MTRPLKPRYQLSWRYQDGGQQGVADVKAEEVGNLQDAVLKVKRRIAKQLSCFPVQIEILEAVLPANPPPKRIRTHRRGHPPLFDGPTEKTCIRVPKQLSEAIRRLGEGSMSKGIAIIAREFFKESL